MKSYRITYLIRKVSKMTKTTTVLKYITRVRRHLQTRLRLRNTGRKFKKSRFTNMTNNVRP